MRPHFQTVLDDLHVLARLAPFKPVVIGTPPLGIETETSDIDIACTARDLEQFGRRVREEFGDVEAFRFEQLEALAEPAVRAVFFSQGWEIEIFCQTVEVANQSGVRHFLVEKRLLAGEPRLRTEIVCLKRRGLKTEPAFATLLDLPGNPYEALLSLETQTDLELTALARRALSCGLP